MKRALLVTLFCIALCPSAWATPEGMSDFAIAEASTRFAIPQTWIRAVIAVESASNAHAVSKSGAMGLMQIMPSTWAVLRQRLRLGADPFDPHDNIVAGAALLRDLYDRFGPGGFLAAYNASPERFLAFLTEGKPLSDETRDYLTRIAPLLGDAELSRAVVAPGAAGDWRAAPLFVASPAMRPISGSDVTPSRLAPQSSGLFASLSDGGRP